MESAAIVSTAVIPMGAAGKIGGLSDDIARVGGKGTTTWDINQIIKNAESVSTAKAGQYTAPRNLNEQIVWKQVIENPSEGQALKLNNDPRFPIEAGFQKMRVNHKLSDGTNIEIHYQYNQITNKAYDIKIVTNEK
jgi:filamentous hemagglutinin